MLEFIDTVIIPFFLDIYDAIGYVGVAIAVALETFIPIIPSEVIVPMAGWKVSQSAADASVVEPLTQAPWTFLGVLIAATLGAVAGSLAGYLIGAWGGRPLLDRYGRYVHIYPDDLDRADAWFERYGGWAVFFARLVPPASTGEMFGFYSVSEKLAGIFGPLAFGLATQWTGSPRAGTLVLLPLLVAGTWLLLRVRFEGEPA